jgi:PAS domain S-box-containing protein
MSKESKFDLDTEGYKSIFNNSMDAVLLTHPDGAIFYANSAAEELFGYTKNEICKLGRSGIVDTTDPNLVVMLDERTKNGRSRGELTFIKKDGSKFPGELSTNLFKDKNGIIDTFMIIRDITGRKNAEKSLKESEERYHSLFKNNHAAMLLIDPNTGNIVDANPAASSFYGYSQEELVKMNIEHINNLQNHDVHSEMQKSNTFQKNNFIFQHTLANGDIRDVDVYSGPINVGGKNLLYSIIHDITQRKQIENDIKDSLDESLRIQDELVILIENIIDEVWFTDTEGNIVLANASARKFQKDIKFKEDSSLNNLISKSDVYDSHGSLRVKDDSPLLRALNGEILTNFDETVIFPGGKKQYRQVSSAPIKNENDKIMGAVAVVRDITEQKKIEESLRISEERLRLAQIRGGVGVWDWNVNTNDLYFTPELEQLYGLSPGTIKTYKDWRDLTHPDDIEKIEVERDNQIANKQPFDLEFRIFHESGDIRWLSTRGGAIYDDNGEVVRVLGINIDITTKKQIEEVLQTTLLRFYKILSNISAGILLVTSDNKVEFVNQEFCDYFYLDNKPEYYMGYSSSDMTQEIRNAYRSPEEAIIHIGEIVDKWKPIHSEEVLMRDGKSCLRDFVPLSIAGKPYGRLWVHVDMTEQKKTEEKLHESNTKLLKEVQDHQKTELKLEELVDELKRSNKELEQFAYVSSHDLQEPLRMVALFTQLLERRYKGKLDADADDYIKFIVEGAQRMKFLIDDLLSYSRVNTKGSEFSTIKMDKIMDNVLSNLHLISKEKNAKITVQEPLPTIIGDESQMMHVFQNLIANGIKFNDKESPEINITTEQDENGCIFSVSDNGIGISPEYHAQIFEIFKRLHDREKYPGTGIGLAICKKIIERHGGKIWVESNYGNGSTFYFNIPNIKKK